MKNPSEYYFNYLLIPFLILLSIVLRSWKRFWYIVMICIVIHFIFRSVLLLKSPALTLAEKDQAVNLLSKITKNSSPFNVSFDVPFNEDTGFRYLLNYYKVSYSGSPIDPLIEFVIPYQKKPVTFFFRQIGLSVPNGWLENNWPEKSK